MPALRFPVNALLKTSRFGMPLYWGGVEPLKGDCSGHIGHVGSYEECAGNKFLQQ